RNRRGAAPLDRTGTIMRMATAVCGSFQRAAPHQLPGGAKPKKQWDSRRYRKSAAMKPATSSPAQLLF
ncbi:MAG TPA: hypothetical protein VN952_12340, partial [Chthoniobacterales bacterium]|nr:hypothetical protein [Chthoniobacterales bacterium]